MSSASRINTLSPDRPIRFAVSSRAQPANHAPILQATIARLKEVFGDDRVIVTELSLSALEKAVTEQTVDIFQSSAGMYVRQYHHGARALVTAASDHLPDPNKNEGTAIVVRADRHDISTLMDAKHMRLAANSPVGFSGYQIGLGEVARQGGNPETFFSETLFTGEGTGMYGVIDAVLTGKADVGFLRLCFLEQFPQEALGLKVLDRKASDLRCAHSTELYPTWSISTTLAASAQLSRRVAGVLLSMPPTSDGLYWGVANDFHSVHALFQTLRIGPYAYLREWTLRRVVSTFWPFLAIFLVCVLALILHGICTERLIQKKSKELKQALSAQAQLEAQARAATEKIHSLQKVGTIGLLCSTLAHELNQPLSALVCYARGLRRLSEKGLDARISAVCEDIALQANRAWQIVEDVRRYAKGTATRKPLHLSHLTEQCCRSVQAMMRPPYQMDAHIEPNICLHAEPSQMQLVIINLLRNAMQAVEGNPLGRVSVTLSQSGNIVRLVIEDNGKTMTPEMLQALEQPLFTKKSDGLGLGVPIVRNIVQAHGGSLTFSAGSLGQSQGLTATVQLPVQVHQEDS